jgi:hypothetical protein
MQDLMARVLTDGEVSAGLRATQPGTAAREFGLLVSSRLADRTTPVLVLSATSREWFGRYVAACGVNMVLVGSGSVKGKRVPVAFQIGAPGAARTLTVVAVHGVQFMVVRDHHA